jgi:hypothetical protein
MTEEEQRARWHMLDEIQRNPSFYGDKNEQPKFNGYKVLRLSKHGTHYIQNLLVEKVWIKDGVVEGQSSPTGHVNHSIWVDQEAVDTAFEGLRDNEFLLLRTDE